MLARELQRMEMSLRAAGEREKIAFLHYPPKTLGTEWTEMVELLARYGVKRCFYGHLHSLGCNQAFEGESHGVRFRLISADHVSFFPQKIL